MANVLLLNGSPHAHGAIDLALTEVAQTLQECGLTTEIVHIGQQDIRGCVACGRCGVLHRCVFDDAVNALAPKFEAADALIVGSPVYYASANGTLTNLLHRYDTAHTLTVTYDGAADASKLPQGAVQDGGTWRIVLQKDGDLSETMRQVMAAGKMHEMAIEEQNVDELIARMYREMAL